MIFVTILTQFIVNVVKKQCELSNEFKFNINKKR